MLCDLIYLTPWMFAVFYLHSLQTWISVAVLTVTVLAWRQDWKASRAALLTFTSDLVMLDLLTGANYVGLIYGLRQPMAGSLPLSTRALLHWTVIFVLYIVWNISAIRHFSSDIKRILVFFSLAEVPIVMLGVFLVLIGLYGGQLQIFLSRSQAILMVALLGVFHGALLFGWRMAITTKTRV